MRNKGVLIIDLDIHDFELSHDELVYYLLPLMQILRRRHFPNPRRLSELPNVPKCKALEGSLDGTTCRPHSLDFPERSVLPPAAGLKLEFCSDVSFFQSSPQMLLLSICQGVLTLEVFIHVDLQGIPHHFSQLVLSVRKKYTALYVRAFIHF